MIMEKTWRTGLMIALLLSIPVGEVRAETPESDEIEQLDEVEVTAARIAPLPRAVPFQLPDLSSVAPLPPDSPWRRGAPVAPGWRGADPSRLLQDNTATFHGNRTRVRYLEPARPPYPRHAREMGWEGTVLLRMEIGPDGMVAQLKVQRSSGHRLLDQAAITAAQRWRFVPETDGGFTMPAIVDVPVRFDLADYVQNEPLQ